MNLNQFATDMMASWDARFDKDWTAYTAGWNNASIMGHDCLRFLYYNRTAGDKRLKPKVSALKRMRRGQLDEERVKIELAQRGYVVNEQQRPFTWDKFMLKGKIDGTLIIDGESIPFDVKSVAPYLFTKAKKEFNAGKVEDKWLKKHTVQNNCYMMLKERDGSLLIYYEPVANDIFPAPCLIDYAMGEEIIAKCVRVNEAFDKHTPPEALNDWDVCPGCDFYPLCAPEILPDVTSDIDADTAMRLESIIKKRIALESDYSAVEDEIEALKKQEKAIIGEREAIMLPNYTIKGKFIDVKEKTVKGYSFFRYWIKEK